MFKQLTTAAAVLAFAGLAQADTIFFDFNNMQADITSGTPADFGTALFDGTLVLNDDANTQLEQISIDGTPQLGAPIVPDDFSVTLDMTGTTVDGGSISFSDGVTVYTASILAGGTVSYFDAGDTFTIQTVLDGPVGVLSIFGFLLDLDGTGTVVTFDLGGSSIRTAGSDADTFVDASLDGNVVPTPTAAAAGFMALGLLAARRRRQA